MRHGTCVTHVPWCISGSLTHGGAENAVGIPGACATRNFTYLARGPWTCHTEGYRLALGPCRLVLFSLLLTIPQTSSGQRDRGAFRSFNKAKTPWEFANMNRERSHGDALHHRPLVSPLYEDATHIKQMPFQPDINYHWSWYFQGNRNSVPCTTHTRAFVWQTGVPFEFDMQSKKIQSAKKPCFWFAKGKHSNFSETVG